MTLFFLIKKFPCIFIFILVRVNTVSSTFAIHEGTLISSSRLSQFTLPMSLVITKCPYISWTFYLFLSFAWLHPHSPLADIEVLLFLLFVCSSTMIDIFFPLTLVAYATLQINIEAFSIKFIVFKSSRIFVIQRGEVLSFSMFESLIKSSLKICSIRINLVTCSMF